MSEDTKKWIQNPTELIMMGMFYTFGFVILKYIRQDKPPAKLRNVKLVYNAIMSIFSFYLFYGVLRLLIINYISASSANPLVCDGELELLEGMEWYFQIFYYSKYVEFIDTFFLVMAGSAGMGSRMTLHLYHHFITPSIVYSTWFYPCTGGWIGPITNGLVHVIMYAYYGLSVLFPTIKKYGNMVTYIQLVQFIGVILYHALFVIPAIGFQGCKCNTNQLAFNLAQYVIFLFLFLSFYINKNRSKERVVDTKANGHAIKTE